ncbi:MAG: hypothetical protein G01um101448_514 [Parcubacteria group bacterium Gr01-1014_48]|nr:MAG: hypothetical protein Greene041614_190 [Parcubacteria group bacterium Greene0416_14]TSC73825.1 MAG: hypothetical protein G01um101448_514 [Parcubacteria group bacterium Gr01-1014_48]TSD01206.1 MAG: hypothetical protein Greene101415_401 [Parcubacteria group bacterium Greene1014_15]TSD07318.1 MAG: hypothetical protein Greene07144_951 [Parcubacteria group bacterium Greene0714_4]
MLKKGTLPQVINYYFTSPEFRREFTRAIEIFFDQKVVPGGTLEMCKGDDARFEEWFVFDFRLRNGQTILQDFYDRNPLHLEGEWREIYRHLQKNEFGFFDVLHVVSGTSVELKSIKSGMQYTASEHTATFSIEEGSTVACRVGWAGTHYEIVGGFVETCPVALPKQTRKVFREDKRPFTLKEFQKLLSHNHEHEMDDENMEDDIDREVEFYSTCSLQELKRVIDRSLACYGALPYVSADLIEEWIQNTDVDRNNVTGEHFVFLTMTFGLCEDRERKNIKEEIMIKLLPLLMCLYARTSQKHFGEKTPFEQHLWVREDKEDPPQFLEDMIDFDSDEVIRCSLRALERFHNDENEKALAEVNRALTLLFEKCTTYQDVFRLYGNKAAMHFALGEEEHGREMLRIALALNSHYDFARMTLESYERGGFTDAIQLGRLKKFMESFEKTSRDSRGKRKRLPRLRNSSSLKNDIGVRYYALLKKYRINFNHPLDISTKITVMKPGKGAVRIGRNDRCPCGAKKADGGSIKYKHCHGK